MVEEVVRSSRGKHIMLSSRGKHIMQYEEADEGTPVALITTTSVSRGVKKISPDGGLVGRRTSPRLQNRSGKQTPSHACQESTCHLTEIVSMKRPKLAHDKQGLGAPRALMEPIASTVPCDFSSFMARRKETLGDSNLQSDAGPSRRRTSARLQNRAENQRPDYCHQKGTSYPKEVVARERSELDHEQQRENVGAPCNNLQIEPGERAQGSVVKTLRIFNKHYLHFVQVEEQRVRTSEARLTNSKRKGKKHRKVGTSKSKILRASKSEVNQSCGEDVKRPSKRPDLKAITKMKGDQTILYHEKRIGHFPGINVGHSFFSRAEMVALGFHCHWLNGIDYMGVTYCKKPEFKNYTFPLAVCIVLSGMYEDDLDNSEEVIYTGQGGHNLVGDKHQYKDQIMARGNLALKNSMVNSVPVRVVRGHESPNSYCGKVYTYDGLYKVKRYWAEKGLSGFTVLKFHLKRLDGQPVLTTKQVFFTQAQAPRSISELRGLVCEDISGGQEDFPIPATNVVDDPPFAPLGYIYHKSMQVSSYLKLPVNANGCKCKEECVDPRICACARLNGSDFPYVLKDGGRLIEAKAVVFECGPNCGCKSSCVNRVSQQGLKYRLEVFRTPKKGWAVRSWDAIPSGAPICEYTGILLRTDEENASGNNFIFDIDCLQTMRGLDGREKRLGDVALLLNVDEQQLEAAEFCIDAGTVGNVARFINHSCEPNLFVQCVLSTHHDIKLARVVLFAADTIPPLQELTYDYGYALDSVIGPDGNIKKMPCYCGAEGCRKRLY